MPVKWQPPQDPTPPQHIPRPPPSFWTPPPPLPLELYPCLSWQQPCSLAGSCPKMLVINQRVILLDWCGPLSAAADTGSGSRMERMNHSDTRPDKCISHSINKWHWSWKLLVVTACATPSRQSKWTIWFRTWSCFCQHSSTGQVRLLEHIEMEPAENDQQKV